MKSNIKKVFIKLTSTQEHKLQLNLIMKNIKPKISTNSTKAFKMILVMSTLLTVVKPTYAKMNEPSPNTNQIGHGGTGGGIVSNPQKLREKLGREIAIEIFESYFTQEKITELKEKFKKSLPVYDRYRNQSPFAKMMSDMYKQGLEEDINSSRYELRQECFEERTELVNNVNEVQRELKSASTLYGVKGADICLSPSQIAIDLLNRVRISLKDMYSYDSAKKYIEFFKTSKVDEILIGLFAHEHSRHFNVDDPLVDEVHYLSLYVEQTIKDTEYVLNNPSLEWVTFKDNYTSELYGFEVIPVIDKHGLYNHHIVFEKVTKGCEVIHRKSQQIIPLNQTIKVTPGEYYEVNPTAENEEKFKKNYKNCNAEFYLVSDNYKSKTLTSKSFFFNGIIRILELKMSHPIGAIKYKFVNEKN